MYHLAPQNVEFFFGRRKSGYLESNVSEISTCPINCDCCPEDVGVCSDVVEIKRSIRKIILPPQLGVTRSGRQVIPHKCELASHDPPPGKIATAPSSTSVRSKSPSLFGRKSSRVSIRSHKSERASSSTSRHELGPPPFTQFKSPTAPRYRPTVTPHKNCFGPGLPEPRKGGPSSFWKWCLLALLLVGVAGTALGPMLLRKARKKCLDLKPCT